MRTLRRHFAAVWTPARWMGSRRRSLSNACGGCAAARRYSRERTSRSAPCRCWGCSANTLARHRQAPQRQARAVAVDESRARSRLDPHRPHGSGFVTLQAILRQADRHPIGDCCVTARTGKTWIPRGLVLALSLLVLGVTSGDIGHALAGGTWHGLETAIVTVDDGPAEPNPANPTSSHVATECPLCRVGRASSAALSGRTTCFTAFGEISHAVFLPEASEPSSPHRGADPARAPPARLSA